jgi:hypothetical protein
LAPVSISGSRGLTTLSPDNADGSATLPGSKGRLQSWRGDWPEKMGTVSDSLTASIGASTHGGRSRAESSFCNLVFVKLEPQAKQPVRQRPSPQQHLGCSRRVRKHPKNDPGMCPRAPNTVKRRHLPRRTPPTTRYPGSPDPFDAEVLAETGPPSAIAQNQFSARPRPPCAEASGCPEPCIAPRPAPAAITGCCPVADRPSFYALRELTSTALSFLAPTVLLGGSGLDLCGLTVIFGAARRSGALDAVAVRKISD